MQTLAIKIRKIYTKVGDEAKFKLCVPLLVRHFETSVAFESKTMNLLNN